MISIKVHIDKHPEYKEIKEWLGVSKTKTWDTRHFTHHLLIYVGIAQML